MNRNCMEKMGLKRGMIFAEASQNVSRNGIKTVIIRNSGKKGAAWWNDVIKEGMNKNIDSDKKSFLRMCRLRGNEE